MVRRFKPPHRTLTLRKTKRQVQPRSGVGHPFYNTYGTKGKKGWRGTHGIRSQHLKQHPYCVECIAEGRPMVECMPVSPHVDHIEPHKGDWQKFTDMSNLQTLCHSHHSIKTCRDNGQWRK